MQTKNGLKEITWRSDLQLMLPSWANSCNGAKSAEAVIASFIGTETAFLRPSCIAFSLRSFSSYKSHSKTTLTWNRQIKILTLSILFWEISKGKSHFSSQNTHWCPLICSRHRNLQNIRIRILLIFVLIFSMNLQQTIWGKY